MIQFAQNGLSSHMSPQAELVVTDGDCTIFYPGTDEPYPGSLESIGQINLLRLVLVTGNPDKSLAEARAAALGADSVVMPLDGKIRFSKRALFDEAAREALAENPGISTGLVLGNRFFCDVLSGQWALRAAGFTKVDAIYVRQPGPSELTTYAPYVARKVGSRALQRLVAA